MKSHERVSPTIAEIANRYHIGFRIQPGEAAAVSGRIEQMNCRLELSGHHGGRRRADGVRCEACIEVLEGLFEVVDALRSIESETLEKLGGVCETRAHYASTERPGHEVILGVEMTLRAPLRAETDNWLWIFLQRMRLALVQMGCHNRSQAEPVGCGPPFPLMRRGQRGCSAAVIKKTDMDKEPCLTA